MRGKEALSAARRRIAELEDQLAEAERKRGVITAAAAQREQELQQRLTRLQSQLEHEVSAVADARVEAVREEGMQKLERLQQLHDERLGEIGKALTEHDDNKLNVDTYSKLHRLLKRGPGEWIVNEVRNRDERRTNAGMWDDVSQLNRHGADRGLAKWQALREEQTGSTS